MVYLQQNDQEKINEMMDRLGEFQEQVVESLIAEGEWFAESGSIDEAKRFLEQSLELDPGNEIAESLLSKIVELD